MTTTSKTNFKKMSYDCFMPSASETEKILMKTELKTIVSMQQKQNAKHVENQLYAALLILAARNDERDDELVKRIFDRLAIMSGSAACEKYNYSMMCGYVANASLRNNNDPHWSQQWCYPNHIEHAQIESLAKTDVLLATLL